jgi:hypothetical protein
VASRYNETAPARGRAGHPVIWDRAAWHSSGSESGATGAEPEGARHINTMLQWLWAHDLTTAEGDLAAQGVFSGELGREPALTSNMVGETGAVFLDHYYGRWLSTLLNDGSENLADGGLDTLWEDFIQHSGALSRVWEL